MPSHAWFARVALVAAITVSVAGCGTSNSTSTSTAGITPNPVAPSTSATTTVAVDGLSLTIPRRFAVVDADAAHSSAAESPELEQLANRLGVTTDKMLEMIKQADLYAASNNGAEQGFLDNINVIKIGASTLPTEAQFTPLLSRLGAKLTSFRTTTAGGLATAVVTYGATTSSGVALTGAALLVVVDGKVVEITVISSDPGVTKRASESMLTTLAPA